VQELIKSDTFYKFLIFVSLKDCNSNYKIGK
jgi:hypothetical protein